MDVVARWRLLLATSTALLAGATALSAQSSAQSSAQPSVLSSMRRLVDLHHTSWTAREGLPESGVVAPMRSPDGYLWLGTSDALIRFDGVRFVRVDSSTASVLQSAAVGYLSPKLVDRAGRLWISRPDGALVVYERGAFREVLSADSSRGPVAELIEDGNGQLWARARRVFVLRGGRPEAPPLPAAIDAREVSGIAADSGGGLLIGTTTGQLWHLSPTGAIRLPSTGTPNLRPLLQDHGGRIWFMQNGFQSQLNGVTTTIKPPTGTASVGGTVAVELNDGSVVLATRGYGLLRWRDGRVDQFSEAAGLTDAVVRGLHQDDDGSLWVTTDAGLDRLRIAPFITLGKGHALPFQSPTSIVADADGSLWMAAFNARALYRLHGGAVRGADSALRVDSVLPPGDLPILLATASPAGGPWVYDLRHQFYRVVDGRVRPVPGLLVASNTGIHALEDARGSLWLGNSPTGLRIWRNGTLTRLVIPDESARTLIVGITQDARGAVWVSMRNPSQLIQYASDTVVSRITSPGGARLPMTNVLSEGGDTLWANADGTLLRLIGTRAATVKIPSIELLLRTPYPSLLVAAGYLWFGGESALGRIPLAALHRAADSAGRPPPVPEFFGSADGLRSAKLTNLIRKSAATAADGRLWFVTPAGLAVVSPAELRRTSRVARAVVEEVRVNGVVSPSPIIPPNPERVEIHFTATELFAPERVHIQYRLDGADGDWVTATGTRSAMYTQLRHGRYRFRVRAWNDDDATGAEATLELRVVPAWYQTWWFAVVLVVTVLAITTALVRARLKEKERRAAERLQARFDAELSERTRLARDLHDTLLQGLTGITLQIQAVQDSLIREPEAAHTALGRILDMTDTTLRESRSMVWEMRAPELNAQPLPVALESAALSLVGTSGIALTFDVTGAPHRLALDTETTILRVGREAIANAIRHSGASTLRVTLSYEAARVCLIVQDNGRGMSPDQESVGIANGHWGLRGMRERATHAGGMLSIDGTNGGGTTLLLCLPSAMS